MLSVFTGIWNNLTFEEFESKLKPFLFDKTKFGMLSIEIYLFANVQEFNSDKYFEINDACILLKIQI